MANIALVSCTKTKRKVRSPAGSLYTSPLFRKSLLYALSRTDRTYILSAKHGVLSLSDVIDPYELSIKDLTAKEKIQWAEIVDRRLSELIGPKDSTHMFDNIR